MTHIPGGLCAAFEANLADSLEAVVGDEATFLAKLDANAPRFFFKFDRIEFA
jgi:hypothetical protein